MLFFAIQLDEEKIKKEHIINLEAAYRSIDMTFAQKDVKKMVLFSKRKICQKMSNTLRKAIKKDLIFEVFYCVFERIAYIHLPEHACTFAPAHRSRAVMRRYSIL